MSAPEVTDKVVEAIDAGRFDVIVLNYANADMVGHTGRLDAAVKAVETIDTCLGRVAAAVEKAGGTLVITADHGNAEMMRDPDNGGPHTAHTLNPVPFLVVHPPAVADSPRRAPGRRRADPARHSRPRQTRRDDRAFVDLPAGEPAQRQLAAVLCRFLIRIWAGEYCPGRSRSDQR